MMRDKLQSLFHLNFRIYAQLQFLILRALITRTRVLAGYVCISLLIRLST